jgi:hypothetical protein
MNNIFDYYKNPIILSEIHKELNRIKNGDDREDCKQEIYAELYDFMPMDDEDAIRIVRRIGRRFRREAGHHYATTAEYRDWNDWENLGNGNYMRKAHYGSAD